MLSLDLSLCMRICNAGMLKQRQGHSDINEFLHPVISNETKKKSNSNMAVDNILSCGRELI
jgi:hypothetical protein